MSRRPPPLLPSRGASPAWLVASGVLLGFISAVVALGLALGLRLAPAVGQRLAGSATVVVSGRMDSGALESSDAAAARAREVIAGAGAVGAVRVLDPAPLDSLLADILGAPRFSGAAGPPRLLMVTWRPGGHGDLRAMVEGLRREGLAAAADDHGLWSGGIERTGVIALADAALGLFAIVAIAAALGALAAGRRAELVWERLGLLARLGGSPGPPVAAIAGAAGLCMGLALAAGAAFVVALDWASPPNLGLPPGFAAPPLPALAMASVVALAAGLAAAGAAARTARRGVRGVFE
ncbi:MAG: hypothetical protein JO111_04690 [Caulobacteraceae bacterium]|nr:hypothetical protein [Caulobacteraceae bacterium]